MRVCGLWLVKLLLSRGYGAHGTVGEPGYANNDHLKKLTMEKLHLFKINLLDYNSLCSVIAVCDGIFHVASSASSGTILNPEVEQPSVPDKFWSEKEHCKEEATECPTQMEVSSYKSQEKNIIILHKMI
ncbi:cinnamoyl-CoA reductase 2-like isoform X2 [Macadamia integrifolia]|uniref:cinnamoyl-CoA reductase 2-like isoform X2 n=1 Tax=Macadamia integrifolia TaxID=60698 RepID=UPI001C4F35A4|nr:cinnamoyl-CoA reductase 2-like isoform X2 [Macadamia integrifolia]